VRQVRSAEEDAGADRTMQSILVAHPPAIRRTAQQWQLHKHTTTLTYPVVRSTQLTPLGRCVLTPLSRCALRAARFCAEPRGRMRHVAAAVAGRFRDLASGRRQRSDNSSAPRRALAVRDDRDGQR